jgi:hypothetical protein
VSATGVSRFGDRIKRACCELPVRGAARSPSSSERRPRDDRQHESALATNEPVSAFAGTGSFSGS